MFLVAIVPNASDLVTESGMLRREWPSTLYSFSHLHVGWLLTSEISAPISTRMVRLFAEASVDVLLVALPLIN